MTFENPIPHGAASDAPSPQMIRTAAMARRSAKAARAAQAHADLVTVVPAHIIAARSAIAANIVTQAATGAAGQGADDVTCPVTYPVTGRVADPATRPVTDPVSGSAIGQFASSTTGQAVAQVATGHVTGGHMAHASVASPSAPHYQGSLPARLVCRIIARLTAEMAHMVSERVALRRDRRRIAAHIRQISMYVCHVALRIPHADVAAAFGRDRSTVGHACHFVEDRRDDEAFDAFVAAIERMVTAVFRPCDIAVDGGADA